jgi:hypothetical protein
MVIFSNYFVKPQFVTKLRGTYSEYLIGQHWVHTLSIYKNNDCKNKERKKIERNKEIKKI